MLSFLGTIGRMLPGYVNGYRMAIQDNWNDLNQYNNVQRGQITNAFMGESFAPELNMLYDRASVSRMANLNQGIDFWKRLYGLRGEFGAAGVQSAMAPDLMYQTIMDRMLAMQQGRANSLLEQDMWRRMMQNGWPNFELPPANGTAPQQQGGGRPAPTSTYPEDYNAMAQDLSGVRR